MSDDHRKIDNRKYRPATVDADTCAPLARSMGDDLLSKTINIFVMTYNRSAFLDRTLASIAGGPFAGVRITILDNCSTDDTPIICSKYEKLLPACRTVRHRINIGASANTLRAIELSTSPYMWILCDDDMPDFSDCDDTIQALLSGKYDCLCVAVPGSLEWEWGKTTTCRAMFERNPRFFHMASFLPAMIYRTDTYDSVTLQKSYGLAGELFPQLLGAVRLLAQDASIFIANRPIVKQDWAEAYFWTLLRIDACWVNTCSAIIPDERDRRIAIYEMLRVGSKGGALSFLRRMIFNIAYNKMVDKELRSREGYRSVALCLSHIFLGCTWDQRCLLLATVPFALLPSHVYRGLRVVYRWAKYSVRGRDCPPSTPPDRQFG